MWKQDKRFELSVSLFLTAHAPAALKVAGDRDGIQQRPGVFVLRVEDDVLSPPAFNHFTLVHDQDMFRKLPDDTQVVGDEQVGDTVARLQSGATGR